ncbi:histidine--tRNA ligase [Anaerosoma tenue]|uniref:histidine--tRNA ligase n=1 Tax=Anaerosoma tenue TaxID=2933588 RepID=UPI002260DD42|nr:histidine--tRNA ligase [Anaerosoma tenue]MCK8114440.1 histidine--tRNA ligase [Anaerosoma tenue]
MNAQAPKGTADMLPAVARAWEHMQRVAQELFARYGYEPVYTPLFEHTDVFTRGIGEATDIVSKEMYTFEDKAGRSITLRPEGTASVVRSALEHNLTANGAQAKLYYAGPMFRYERPQKGRMRQFWQIGIECLGSDGATADAEVITVLWRYFETLGIPAGSMRLLLNSMGDEQCRPAYRDSVAAFIRARSAELCDECVRRAESNPLRAFDCKKDGCRTVMADAPLLRDALCDACAAHYAEVKTHLNGLGIPYVEDSTLVRGLDYYTRTVFEIQVDAGLGSQNAIGGGGRYDRLMQEYGGPPTPGLGFALGFERTLLALEAAGVDIPAPPRADVFVARVDDSVLAEVFALAQRLRDAGIATELDHQGRSLKSQFKQADRLGARRVAVVGPDEIASGEFTLRDMESKQERRVALSEAVAAVTASLV